MTARKPNDTTRVRGKNRYGKRTAETDRMLHGELTRADHASEHDDTAPGLDDIPSHSERNETNPPNVTHQPKGVRRA